MVFVYGFVVFVAVFLIGFVFGVIYETSYKSEGVHMDGQKHYNLFDVLDLMSERIRQLERASLEGLQTLSYLLMELGVTREQYDRARSRAVSDLEQISAKVRDRRRDK